MDFTQEEITDCLSKQLCEYELLKAMYSEDGEIILTEKGIIEEIENFISNQTIPPSSNLDYVINLMISEIKVEIFANLPLLYPIEQPDICVRCNRLNRYQETSLNSELMDYIGKNYSGEVCLYTVITWLQDNFDMFSSNEIDVKPVKECSELLEADDKFERLWIYSHHIYNKKKREEIMKTSKELKLTGFCLPGKPGVICIEGKGCACQEWWRYIKSMNWKKISIRKIETFELGALQELQKFPNFEELHFTKNDNMSELFKFMHKHGCGDIFNELFGFSNP